MQVKASSMNALRWLFIYPFIISALEQLVGTLTQTIWLFDSSFDALYLARVKPDEIVFIVIIMIFLYFMNKTRDLSQQGHDSINRSNAERLWGKNNDTVSKSVIFYFNLK